MNEIMNEKLKKLFELYEKKKSAELHFKETEEEYKQYQAEIFGDCDDKFSNSWYDVTKTVRTSYKLKKGVDEPSLVIKYPEATKIDTSKLYQIADNPSEYIEESNSEYFLIKKSKTKTVDDF